MSGAGARGRLSPASGGAGDSEPRSGGSRTRSVSATRGRKPSPRPGRDVPAAGAATEEKKPAGGPTLLPSLSVPAGMRRQELLLRSGLSLDASCSSDASTDSFCSRASTGRIGRPTFGAKKKKPLSQTEYKAVSMLERDGWASQTDATGVKRRCAWVTANTDPCYAAFHDEEWGVPVHDDKKLFELLVLSGALAELTWPAILNKRAMFREVFMDFDPLLVSKLSEKKIIAPGSPSSSLLSEQKLRGVIENARQILKIVEEFGSFDKYCWSFVNYKPILSRFRYPRQVPVKTSKADAISKDLVRRGFRSVGPTVVYTFMQVSGMTNDHLISCYRFAECASAPAAAKPTDGSEANSSDSNHAITEQKMNGTNGLAADI
ncbi:hypothetical protein HU200_031714 [Digitaria exilis]|uniref:DNA-3-methyladenine glycosylase I n=1 Tax=Digitaria exilis TaxID=1010633 RepID=A0A835BVF3_9POAL|nr:hypothetical protein HU200_031714 [Digitaria exilis]CAB3485033.1 unnamed protein product [Digitaria exilis]